MTPLQPPMMQPLCFDFEGTATIPLGHEVEVTIFDHPKKKPEASGVMVTDLTTGVVYAPSWLYRDEATFVANEGPVPMHLRTDLEMKGRVRGRVVYCRIVFCRRHSRAEEQRTTLLVDVSASPPYR